MGDHYRPSYYNHPPPGFNPMPPLPYGPPPDMPPPPSYYQFGANSYNRQGGYGPQGPYGNNAFNFNANAQLPRFPEERRAQYARQEEARYNDRRAFGPPRNDGGDRRHGEYNRRGDGALRSRRGRPMPRVATADRPLLVYERSGTPDQLAGMATNGEARFLDVDELSDSSEEPMEESDASHPLGEDTQDTDENFVVTKTVQVLSTEVKPAAPKWTSAEVYTELPPVDDSARKKKNIVKMIRKARVTGQPQASGANQVAANDNFISFDFEDDDVQEDEEALIGQGVPGAPTGPKAFDQGGLSTPLQPQPPVSFSGQMVSGTIDMPKPSPIDVNLEITESVTAVLEGDRKRKRSEDDTDIAEVPQPKYAKGLKLFGFGAVLEEWNGVESGRALPWLDGQNYKLTENAGFRLHKEICDFYDFAKPQDFEHAMRLALVDRLRSVVRRWNPLCTVEPFGSFASGLYLPNADMDVVVVSHSYRTQKLPSVCQSRTQMFLLAAFLEETGFAQAQSTDIISGAKVPLIKFVDELTGLRVDMSFENDTGIAALATFAEWKSQFPAMPVLVTIIKQFLLMRGMNEVVSGGIGGMTVTCLVTSMLQNMPRVQSGELKPEDNLGEVLLEFLDLYGNGFDISRTAIRMKPAGYMTKAEFFGYNGSKQARRLTIINPHEPKTDIAGGSKFVHVVFEKFAKAREEILLAMRSSARVSLLDWMLGGNYSSYMWHRNKLRQLFQKSQPGLDLDPTHHSISRSKTDTELLAKLQQEVRTKMDAEGKKVLKKRLERKLKTQQQKQKVSTEEHQKQEASKQERQARIQEEQELRKLRAKDRAIQFTKNHPQVPVVPEILTKNMARSLLLKHPDPPKQKKSSGVKTRSKNKA